MRSLFGNLLLAAVAIICLSLLSQTVRCNLRFEDLLPFSRNHAAPVHLTVLGLVIVGVLLLIKHAGQR
jgi:hypothetical protein